MTTADASRLPGRAREARANDDAVLRAAREVFAEQGYDAPMAAVAQRAGVGVGGIYRRYANKDALIDELRRSALDAIVSTARSSAQASLGDERGAVGAFLTSYLETAGTRLSSVLNRSTPLTPELSRLSAELHDALTALIELDRPRGLVPHDFSAGDIMAATLHLRPVAAVDPSEDRERNRRHLDYFLLGLRAAAANPVTAGIATSWDDWMRLNSMPSGDA
ncbi:TetR/AcrR family transcriptional regulator [Microbacterium helvum]|uniref:TetR/AcrR family transcriptional regulator n=1 Tax=Microbacterium helvum TaxID=2773713 RepID=UPI002964A873|nr:helix-turn-helix domain-containing protein [Microbacterium helvum]